MARETQKEKIDRLERELEKKTVQLKTAWDELEKLERRLSQIDDKNSQNFKESSLYKQIIQEVDRLKEANKLYQNREERNNKIRNQQVELINKLQEENNSLKQKYKKLINDTNIHNARGAGRKPQSQEKTNEIVNRIEILLKQGKKEKEICEVMKISRNTYFRYKRLIPKN